MSKPDGGSAFPNITGPGMSLRDYFAAEAMKGQFALMVSADAVRKSMLNAGVSSPDEMVAKLAYKFADAMLKEREK